MKNSMTLCADDEPAFNRIVDALNSCFGKSYLGYQRSTLKLNDSEMVWFTQISCLTKDGYRSAGEHGWINYTEDEWNHICEENHTVNGIKFKYDNYRNRYVFAKNTDGKYIFRGIYQFDAQNSTAQKRVYKRISTIVDLPPQVLR